MRWNFEKLTRPALEPPIHRLRGDKLNQLIRPPRTFYHGHSITAILSQPFYHSHSITPSLSRLVWEDYIMMINERKWHQNECVTYLNPSGNDYVIVRNDPKFVVNDRQVEWRINLMPARSRIFDILRDRLLAAGDFMTSAAYFHITRFRQIFV